MTKDIEINPLAPPQPPTTDPVVGQMLVSLTMHVSITEPIVNDLMRDIAENLQTVTHLINRADFKANVNGVILTYGTDILPAMVGDLSPVPHGG